MKILQSKKIVLLLIFIIIYSCDTYNYEKKQIHKIEFKLKSIGIATEFPMWFFGNNLPKEVDCSYVFDCYISIKCNERLFGHFDFSDNDPNIFYLSYKIQDSIYNYNLHLYEKFFISRCDSTKDFISISLRSENIYANCSMEYLNELKYSIVKTATIKIRESYRFALPQNIERAGDFIVYPIETSKLWR